MKKPSETDWARIDQMTDEEIDTSDIPPLDEAFEAGSCHYSCKIPLCRLFLIPSVLNLLLDLHAKCLLALEKRAGLGPWKKSLAFPSPGLSLRVDSLQGNR